jgi:DNA ligase D-like protein (predicted polymerase)
MLIRKNTKAFKTILEIVETCHDKPDRDKLIRLYITKAGHSINERISVAGIQGDSGLFYDMTYQTILTNLKSSNRQLHQSDDLPGIYFFHSSSDKNWAETPFEFDEAVKKEFGSLPELPVFRKKEKAEKVILPTSNGKAEPKTTKKEKVVTKKPIRVIDKGPKQPDYKLKHKFEFSDLDKLIFRHPQLSKKDVLDYYDKISEYLLPYLKDRPQMIRRHSNNRQEAYLDYDALKENDSEEIPSWVKTMTVRKENEPMLLCNDKDHLLFFVQIGGTEFCPFNSRTKSISHPDYIVIGMDTDDEFAKIIDVALATEVILTGLKLPSFVKTDGRTGLHIYIPLDAKSKFETGNTVAEYICKLIRIKVGDLVKLKGLDEHVYGKVTLDYSLNEEGAGIVAPYSLVSGESPMVATPLLWDEVKEGLKLEDFNDETIFKRLKQLGDPFEALFKKKVNSEALLQRIEENYAFLF